MRTRGDQYKGKLKIGQKVYSGLYGGRYGVITEIRGDQRPETIKAYGGGVMVTGGSAQLTVVFDDYSKSTQIPESIIRGVQWEIYDEIENCGEVLKLIERAEEMRKGVEIALAIKAERDAKERESLPTQYPGLVTLATSGKKSILTTAANIRKELKAAFPKTKFSVTCDHGSSIDISWTDGPISDEVQKIGDKYRIGSFDGMADCYEYKRSNFTDVFGGAQYVFTRRSVSKELTIKVAAEWGYKDLEFDKWGVITNLDYHTKEHIQREAWKTPGSTL